MVGNATPFNFTPLPGHFFDPQKAKNNSRLFALSVVVTVLVISSLVFARFNSSRPQVAGTSITSEEKETMSPAPSNSLKKAVGEALEDSKGTYGVAIKNMRTGEAYFLNEHTKFQSASLYKVWIMAMAYEKIKEGKLRENQIIEDGVKALNKKFNLATGEADLQDGYIKLSVHDALEKMITYSDNYAALILSSRLGLNAGSAFHTEYGLVDSTLTQPPKTTAGDVLLFFEKLYNGDLADEVYTAKMIDLLRSQKLNDVLPKYLPNDISVAHKTGDLGPTSHDAGIVYGKNGDYIIALLSDTDNVKTAKERMAKISKAVYEYFEKGN